MQEDLSYYSAGARTRGFLQVSNSGESRTNVSAKSPSGSRTNKRRQKVPGWQAQCSTRQVICPRRLMTQSLNNRTRRTADMVICQLRVLHGQDGKLPTAKTSAAANGSCLAGGHLLCALYPSPKSHVRAYGWRDEGQLCICRSLLSGIYLCAAC